MMDVFGFVFFRGIERWMVVIGGLIFGYLGYKLFLYGVNEGHGKLDAENQLFKVTFSGSGPGLFFMAFGALILVSSVYSTGTVTHNSLLGATGKGTVAAASATPAALCSDFCSLSRRNASEYAFGVTPNSRMNIR